MSAELAAMMFDILSKRQGDEVHCTAWANGKEYEKQGILTEIVPYERVTIDDLDIPFDNGKIAISEIRLMNGKVVFANPYVVPEEFAHLVGETEATVAPESTSENSVSEDSTPAVPSVPSVEEEFSESVVEEPESLAVSESTPESSVSENPVEEVMSSKVVDFEALEAFIGTHVSAKSWRFGVAVPYEGVLTEVVPYDRMTLNNNIIPFAGENEAVEEIWDANGNILYYVPEAKGYTAKDQMGLVTAQLEMLGRSVKMEEMEGKGKSK